MKNRVPILIVDDDLEDCQMLKEAFHEIRLLNSLHFAHNGEELMDYLHHRPPFDDAKKNPVPGLILLDLNMPKKDGKEALIEIKKNPEFCHIPIVMLTTSQAEEDVFRSYNLGVNSYISKPVSFEGLVTILKEIGHYWLEVVRLPEPTPTVGPMGSKK